MVEKSQETRHRVDNHDGRDLDAIEDAGRREALTQLGRFAYAAPVLALLAQAKGAQADYGGGGGKIRDGGKSSHGG